MSEKTSAQRASWLGLEDRVCVVTGAASGIGAETARQLAAQGAAIAVLDRDEAGAKRVAAEIEQAGGKALALFVDLGRPDTIEVAAQRVEDKLGVCQVLVNNAAAIYPDALLDVKLDKWNQLMAVNVTGTLLCSQAFGRQMVRAGSGSMIHVASLSGKFPQPYSGAYSVSKAAVMMLSRLLTVELAEHRIRSNVVSPSMVITPMSEVIYKDAEVRRRREQLAPAGRIGMPSDLAQAILFLASDRSGYINGQELLVDGGLSQTWLALMPRPGFEKKDAQA
jgi:NAD(P)-dependent dehydrogenase (short-subunit alcohol dehydrogenase family)